MSLSKHFAAAFAFLAFIVFIPACSAQNASLTGVVKDPQGAIVPGASISLTAIGKQVTVKSVTNGTGEYDFPILQPGDYELKAEAPGFQVATVSPIPLAVDQRGRADVTLSVGGTATSVEVTTTGVSAVETESSSVGDVIGSKTITEIPLNGRFFLDLAVLAPGSVLGSTNRASVRREFTARPVAAQ